MTDLNTAQLLNPLSARLVSTTAIQHETPCQDLLVIPNPEYLRKWYPAGQRRSPGKKKRRGDPRKSLGRLSQSSITPVPVPVPVPVITKICVMLQHVWGSHTAFQKHSNAAVLDTRHGSRPSLQRSKCLPGLHSRPLKVSCDNETSTV